MLRLYGKYLFPPYLGCFYLLNITGETSRTSREHTPKTVGPHAEMLGYRSCCTAHLLRDRGRTWRPFKTCSGVISLHISDLLFPPWRCSKICH